MDVRGIVKFSLLDFPGQIACIIFTSRCNFRCPYCHNPCLVFDPESQPEITEAEFFHFLEQRRGKLDGVVVSGGEPTIQEGLIAYCAKIKQLGFALKLDTNGSNPQVVEALHAEVGIDAIGLDFKAPAERYSEISFCALPDLSARVKRVASFAIREKIALDVRTTVHRALLSPEDLAAMRQELDEIGVGNWTLQQFNPVEVIDEHLPEIPTYSDSELVAIARSMPGGKTKVRGLSGVVLQ